MWLGVLSDEKILLLFDDMDDCEPHQFFLLELPTLIKRNVELELVLSEPEYEDQEPNFECVSVDVLPTNINVDNFVFKYPWIKNSFDKKYAWYKTRYERRLK